LELAIEAASKGSLAIACVITDAESRILSEGRNQLYDECESRNKVKGTLVSHAELNAIANLPRGRERDKSVVMYATVEPCPMCAGAIAMSGVRDVRIASQDPWAGAMRLFETDPYMSGKGIKVSRETGFIEELFFYLHLISQQGRVESNHPFYSAMKVRYPSYFSNFEKLKGNSGILASFKQGNAPSFLEEYLQWRRGQGIV
jgi:tRNA(adenine34) deaminase